MRRIPDPPQVIVQKLTAAFNKHDLDAVSVLIAANCVVAAHGGETEQVGAPAICAQYHAAFEERPRLRIGVMGRMVQGNIVVQHESLSRGLGVGERRIAVYTVNGEKVTRVEFIR
ncbi:MAG: hypothetical protein FD124_3322 [Alphaproteobacteria bacterium]|nr:MAG: hypothetical protein FD160_15 [Caulobacteraceae bacterium]TPW02669.1 MAG: hypothetical protein FD124_3322 [Alphaproteobacteria bacterium]